MAMIAFFTGTKDSCKSYVSRVPVSIHFGPKAKGVAQLNIEVPQRLEQSRVLQRTGVHGVEADVTRHLHHLLLRRDIVAGGENGD